MEAVERRMRTRIYGQYLWIIAAIMGFEIASTIGMARATVMIGDAGETVAAAAIALVLGVIFPLIYFLDRTR
jgi:hypothetical protein